MTRPPASTLAPMFLDSHGRVRSKWRSIGGNTHCRRRHVERARVVTPQGVWVAWHGDPTSGWLYAWLDELPNPEEMVWCPCNRVRPVDLGSDTVAVE